MANHKQAKINHPLARDENVVVESVGDETVVYDLETHVAHALRPLAAAVYSFADGKNTPADIAELASYRLDTPVTEADVIEAVVQLEAISLISAPILNVQTGVSRRHALKTFAAAGAGSMLVLSVATAAASATGTCTTVPNSNDACVKSGVGSPGPGGCDVCQTDSQCGSDAVCCCVACDGTSGNSCCQPVCIVGKTCPTGSRPLVSKPAGSTATILCPSGYAQYNANGCLVKCCEVGCAECKTEKNGVCCAA